MQNSFNDINLAQCRRLFLKNYEISIYIGVYEHEKKTAQSVIFNIDLYIPLNLSTPTEDALEEVVDYDLMIQTIRSRTQNIHIQLQETLCDNIVDDLLKHPKVMAARVSTSKPDAYAECFAVGVEVFRTKVMSA